MKLIQYLPYSPNNEAQHKLQINLTNNDNSATVKSAAGKTVLTSRKD